MPASVRKTSAFATEWLIFALCALVLGAVFGRMIHDEYRVTSEGERNRLVGAAALTGSLIAHRLEAINTTLATLRAEVLEDWPTRSRDLIMTRERLRTLAEAMTSVRTLAVLNATGAIVSSNLDALVGQSFAHREYFQAARANPHPDVLHVSPPFLTTSGVWLVTLSRAVVGPDGNFVGVVLASLDPQDFQRILDVVRHAPDAWATLVHGDGLLFVWEPRIEGMVGKSLAQPGAFFQLHRESGRMASFFEGVVYANNEDSMFALQTIQPEALRMDKPLVVGFGRNMDAILGPWRGHVRDHALLYAVLLGVGSVSLFATQRWRARADRAADQAASLLRAARADLESFFAITPNMLGIIDFMGVCRALNPAWTTVLGYSPLDLEGRSCRDLFHSDDSAVVEAAIEELRAGRTVSGLVARFRRKDGAYRFLEWSAAARDDLIYAAALDVTERQRTEQHLYDLAYHDRLTGLPNRTLFFDRLAQVVSQALRGRKRAAVLFIDLDGFKKVNDEHGHDAGDTVLRAVAARFLTTVRASDTVARIGGDEFVLILPEIGGPDAAAVVARKILAAVAPDIALSATQTCAVGASIGIAVCPENGANVDDLLMAADGAMYQSKKGGKNRYVFAGDARAEQIVLDESAIVGVPEIDEQHAEMAALVNRICAALRTRPDEFDLERLFTELAEFTHHHFATEHRLMQAHAYPGLAAHDAAHRELLAELGHIRAELSGVEDRFLFALLRTWLLEHILTEDKPLGAFLRSAAPRPSA